MSLLSRRFPFYQACLLAILLACSLPLFCQTETATISGTITDPTGAVINKAGVKLTNVDTGISVTTTSNDSGLYVFSTVRPGHYRIEVRKQGFRNIALTDLTVNVQDVLSRNFKMQLGAVDETVTVNGSAATIDTASAAVSTVVDNQFVENMPLNGRSLQSLIALAPGVVFTSSNLGDGQFSVNGQRSNSNYFMVDGVSANFGVSPDFNLSQTAGGATPALTAAGGTNGLVSIDAMQEFRIQTSSYAPEFGRSPGAQISLVTKSGTNQFHGTAFDYLRNDIFDARDFFDVPPLPKPPLRQNDFGGTLGGPIVKNKTFFFFSYEGLRLLQPQTASALIYTASARAAVAPAYQPFINALPLPTAPPIDPTCDNVTNACVAPLTVAYSNPSSLNATSLRVDHNLTKKITFFGRYNHAPSYGATRFWEIVEYDHANTDTITAGFTFILADNKLNDFRGNWSRSTGGDVSSLTNFHGAVVPSNSSLFPSSTPYTFDTSQAFVFFPDGGGGLELRAGTLAANVEKQLNFIDTFSWTLGAHQLKFGVDYRHINSTAGKSESWAAFPGSYTSLTAGTAFASPFARDPFSVNTNNYSLFGQDTWRATQRLTLTYGLRWEINTSPQSATSGKPIYAMVGIFDSNPLGLIPGDLWQTKLTNFAPRVGAAYQVTGKTVVRGGFGLFYGLGYGGVGEGASDFPYSRDSFSAGEVPLDLTSSPFQPPPFSATIDPNEFHTFQAVDPHLQLPFSMQWNAAIEREIGTRQTLTATYLGSDSRRLLREDVIKPPAFLNSGGSVSATRNAGCSHYNALQVQFQRRMSHGLQALVSYSLSQSSDLGSSDSRGLRAASVSQVVLPPLTPSAFDVRHSISGAVSYEIPAPAWGPVGNAILKGWAVDGLVRASSAWPINIVVTEHSPVFGFYTTQVDIVPGQSFWLPDPTEPGGKVLNSAAFKPPSPGQTGNFPRNGLRFPVSPKQMDMALRRRFNLSERVKLDLRAEYFNVFNHPNFGAPGAPDNVSWGFISTPNPGFGKIASGSGSTNSALGGQNALYAQGGSRSGQFTLKLTF